MGIWGTAHYDLQYKQPSAAAGLCLCTTRYERRYYLTSWGYGAHHTMIYSTHSPQRMRDFVSTQHDMNDGTIGTMQPSFTGQMDITTSGG